MKQYTPEKLVAVSRYKTLFPTLSPEIQRDVYSRMRVLIEEEKQYCDQGNYKHLAQILTTIALYEVLQQHGKSEPEAFKIISEAMWAALTPKNLSENGSAFILPPGHEENPALWFSTWLRRRLALHLALGRGPQKPFPFRVSGMPVLAHFPRTEPNTKSHLKA